MSLDHDQVRRYYNQEYYAGDHNGGSVPWHVRTIANRLGTLGNAAALDVACGDGRWLAELARRGASVTGIDISTRALEFCRARVPVAQLHEGSAESLPFEDRRFDVVTCLGSLEHFLDPHKALLEMRRVGRPNARFLILVPNAQFLTRRLNLYRGTQQTAIKEDVRSLREWTSLFVESGLRVEKQWRDLRMLSRDWIERGPWQGRPLRFLQALALPLWPIAWQYQVYFLCRASQE